MHRFSTSVKKRDSFSNDAVPIDKLILPMSSSKSSASKPYLEKQLREFGLTGFEGRLDAMNDSSHGFPWCFSLQLRCGFSCLLFWIPGTKLPKNVFYRQEKALEALNEFLWMKVVGCFQ